MLALEYSLWVSLLGVAFAIINSKSLLRSLVFLVVFSLLSATLYLVMQAPDVAMTEAAIGAAISTIFLLITVRNVGSDEISARRLPIFSGLVIASFVAVMVSIAHDLPEYGDAESPANTGSAHQYIATSYEETGVPNVVTSVLASYRGLDTLGEVYVILAASLGVLLILPVSRRRKNGASNAN